MGLNWVLVKCYCKGCYHIFTTGYNLCGDYMGGNDNCPYCGTNDQVVREDGIDIYGSTSHMVEKFLKDKPDKLKEHYAEVKERKRMFWLLKNYDNGWYPPEDYPMPEDSKC